MQNIQWHIGCSGFSYKEWKEEFYPAGLPQSKWFHYYTHHLINNCDLLQLKHKKDMIDYLEDFYKTINNKREVQRVFVENLSRS
jgi:hypothetical protein